MNNPYAWNQVNINLVFGRDRLLNELLSGLPGANRCSFGLTAGRRMGKTTVLRAVESEISHSSAIWTADGLLVIPVYIDGLALPRPLTPSQLWSAILGKVQVALAGTTSTVSDFSEFVELTRELIEQREEAVRIVVLIDEIEHILVCDWADGFFANWRALLTNMPGLSNCFTAVFSGAQELARLKADIGSPLMDVLEWRMLGPLGFEDAQRLIEEPTRRQETPVVLSTIYSETGGHPMLLQYLMQRICHTDCPTTVDAVRAVANGFISARGWQFGEWWNKYCSETAQRIYFRLEASEWTPRRDLVREFGSRDANDAVDILRHVGLAEESDDGLNVRRIGQMFERWQRDHGAIIGTGGFDPIVAARLRALDHDLAAKYLSAWGILTSNLMNYSGAVGEVRDVITLVLHQLAPDDSVIAEVGFKFEGSQKTPTRRQRARYIARQNDLSSEQGKTVGSEVELLESRCEQIALIVSGGYSVASALTHTTATRDLAHQALRLSDSILLQLLPSA